MNYIKLKKQLILHEGLKLRSYNDTVGKVTIGVGRNISDVGISEYEAGILLYHDVEKCVSALNNAFPWWNNLSDVRRHVLIDMCFNLGITGLAKFIITLEDIRIGNYQQASKEMLNSLWAAQVWDRAKRLSKMMATNEFPEELK